MNSGIWLLFALTNIITAILAYGSGHLRGHREGLKSGRDIWEDVY